MTDTVPIESIASAPLSKPPSEPSSPTRDPFTGRDSKLDQHLGRVGAFIGGGPEKAGNIACVVIVASLLVLVIAVGISAWLQKPEITSTSDKVITGALSLVTGALGYLFGNNGGKNQ